MSEERITLTPICMSCSLKLLGVWSSVTLTTISVFFWGQKNVGTFFVSPGAIKQVASSHMINCTRSSWCQLSDRGLCSLSFPTPNHSLKNGILSAMRPQVTQKGGKCPHCLACQMFQSKLKSQSLRAWDSRSDNCKAEIHIPNSPSRVQLWVFRGLHLNQDFRLYTSMISAFVSHWKLVKNGEAKILPQTYPVSITALGPRTGTY